MKSQKIHRQKAIIDLLQEHGKVETALLSRDLGVTEMTIRRDIEQLEKEGVLYRVYGGAVPTSGRSFEPPFSIRLTQKTESKTAIATQAARLVPRGANVALDFGTKTYFVAKELRKHPGALIAPTGLHAARELAKNPAIRILMPGGHLKPNELSIYGSDAEDFFRSHRWDVSLVSIAGIDTDQGLTDYNRSDAKLKASLIHNSDCVVILAEERYLGAVSFAPVGSLEKVHIVVTDAHPDHKSLTDFHKRGINIISTQNPPHEGDGFAGAEPDRDTD
ncbi:DeoR/GlpR family DNA-binding transcription regulator [Streptomyces scopuliridis]|uniref:HTH deoR-type domain-containing protein n=1 Tax=Streptomyces scopuliridis RB72 TaxID=1440053 RepID=A0A2T7TEV3_9ACTN|nr:DeoR/GlpR family DNA-binding transcription regulator [Streptomyces scopuliridis]PVE13675.1 hypothetical protein Y717_14685 [Streptomyces scopuliridis RB72]